MHQSWNYTCAVYIYLRATAHAADPFCVGGQGVTQGSHLAASDGRVLAEQANDG